MNKQIPALIALATILAVPFSHAGTFPVTNLQDAGPGSFREAIFSVNGASPGDHVIDATSVTGTITLASSLPILIAQGTTTINGPGAAVLTVNGANTSRVFFVGVSTDAACGSLYATPNALIKINGLTIANGRAKGGDAGVNAGGGAGLGGGLFVNAGTVILSNVNFIGNAASGGRGGDGPGAGGGGGGLGGAGGNGGSTTNDSWGGGGGGFGYSASGGSNGAGTGAGEFSGGCGGGVGNGSPGGVNGGGGFGPFRASNGFAGGGGGVGGGAGQGYFDYTVFPAAWHAAGGAGGFAGGGGGGGGYQFDGNSNGGNGGFGGGGGAGQGGNYGGFGGFGGGAGSGAWPGAPGYGGGSATNRLNAASAGGGGLAAGGAIFVRSGARLTLIDCNFSGNTVTGGTGGMDDTLLGGNGAAIGAALFLGNDTTNTVNGASVMTIPESVGGGNDTNANGGLVKAGTGTLILGGNNSYVGPTVLAGGILEINGTIAASSGITVGTNTTLRGVGIVGDLTLNAGGIIAPGPGIAALSAGNATWNGAGRFDWQLYDATGTPGTGYDVLDVNGTLDLTTTTNFVINLATLSAPSPETAGNALNFDNTRAYSWPLVRTTDGLIRFNAGKFLIVTNGFANPLGTGRFSVKVVGNDLVLAFSTVPTAVTLPASGISGTNATLNGSVTPNGAAALAYFRYGLTAGYGSTTTNVNVGGGTNAVALSTTLFNLDSSAIYHFQVVATNSSGISYGDDRTFTTRVTNADLAALTTSAGAITPAFDPAVTNYTATVGNATTTATVTPTGDDPAATMEMRINSGTYTAIISGVASDPLPLNVGANPIDVKVTAQDAVTTRTYTLTVNRAPSTNAFLADLTLSAGPFTPTFNANVTNYNATVSSGTGSVTVTPISADGTAAISVSINGGPFTAVPSGSASTPLVLNAGFNPIDVKVIAQDGTTTRIYSLAVIRLAPPVATTQPATAITITNATLNATVNPNGKATVAFFQWGLTTDYGTTTTPVSVGSGSAAVAVNAPINGLLPGGTYHFTIVASNEVGTATGADASFTTPALAPTATTQPASDVTGNTATLNATVNPNGAATTVYFQWGTNTSYGNITSLLSAGSGNNNVAINTALGGLLPGTTYHFLVVASNNVGTVTGTNVSFTTPALAPVATAQPATALTASNATLNATVHPNGAATTAYFQWGLTTSYGATTALTNVGSGTATVAVNAPISGLLPGTTYHYALAASNSVGLGTSADATFTTPALAPVATTQPASNVTATAATLNATVNPQGAATTVYFEWGTNTNYGSRSTTTSAGSGTSAVDIHIALGSLLPGTMYHFAVVASNSVAVVTGTDATFTTPALVPAATTQPVSDLAATNATLNATVNPNGATTTVYFRWGLTTSYGNTTTSASAGSGTDPVAVNTAVTGLLPGTLYHFLVVASNSVGSVTGSDATFTTPALAPTATTQPATSVTASGATLNASVNPNGTATTAYFQFGTNTTYGSTTAPASIGGGTSPVAMNAPITSLLPGVTYQFVVVASNSVGVLSGADQTFTTAALIPVATVQPASAVTVSNATLNASVNPNGAATTVYFVWGLTTGYGNTTTPSSAGSGTDPVAVNAAIASLLPGTTYHFAVVASNSVGSVTSSDATFTTPALVPVAMTQPATGVTAGSATLHASVNPRGAVTTTYFQLGTNTSYGSTTAATSAGSGNSDVPISAALNSLLPGTTYHFAVVASNSVGSVTGADEQFTTLALAPVATTLPVSGLAPSNATLNASVNPNGAETAVVFLWGATPSYGRTTTVVSAGSGPRPVSLSETIGDLLPGTTYHYVVAASNNVGMFTGADVEFRTPAVAPVAATLPATDVAPGSATLNASVTPRDSATVVYFEWGTSMTYGQTTPTQVLDSGFAAVPVNSGLSGLTPGVTYHFRVVASNSVATARGEDRVVGAPSLTVTGANPLTNECHTTFTDPGATARGFAGWTETTLAASYGHSLAVRTDGSVAGWGLNDSGQATPPEGLGDVVAVSAGRWHSLALRGDGVVAAWGSNSQAQASAPAGLSNVIAIAAGGYHSLALVSDGTAVGWGSNDWGQATVPVGLSNVIAVAAGGYHSLALKSDGNVVAWGDNVDNQTNLPAAVSNVVLIAAGLAHNLALRGDGAVVAWGDNSKDQSRVPALSNVVGIAAGFYHSLALLDNGHVVAWGLNDQGQADVPAGLSNVVAIAAGGHHSLAMEADGTVLGWGDDTSGQTSAPPTLVAAVPPLLVNCSLTHSIEVTGAVDANTPGTYQLNYAAADVIGTSNTASRTVVVVDTTAPAITCPSNITQSVAAGTSSLVVNFAEPAVVENCSTAAVVCTPPSGAAFAAGSSTTVRCVATDVASNAAECSFQVLVNLPASVAAGSDQIVTLPVSSVNLNGTATDDSLPDALSTLWTKVSGPGAVTFGNANALSTTASFATNGVYVLRLTADDGLVSVSDDVTITIDAPPVINAGSAQVVTLPVSSVNLSGTATDDGLPAVLSTLWTKVSGPGTVTFGNAAMLSTTASFATNGIYVLRLTANDGFVSASSDVTVIVNARPVVSAGTAQVITLPVSVVNLNGSATDDGLPTGMLNTTWSIVSGPGSVIFGNAGMLNTTAAFVANGTYLLRLTASDGLASVHNDVTIVVNARPAITQSLGASGGLTLADGTLIVAAGQPTTLTVDATDADSDALSYAWDFGDGATSTNFSPTYTFTNCQPRTVSVTISDGMSATNHSVVVQPACPMTLSKEMARVYFDAKHFDTFAASGYLPLPTNFARGGVKVALDAGGGQQIFVLDTRGKARNDYGTFKLAYNKRKGWSFTVKLKGVWRHDWAAYGLSNQTVRKKPVRLPVFVVFDTDPLEAFVADDPLLYTAVQNRGGRAKK